MLFSCIDHTTLSPLDTEQSVVRFCQDIATKEIGGNRVAAVCVYPRFVEVAKKALRGSDISVASVAGGFPHSQIPLTLKVAEVDYVVGCGADELDIVLSCGLVKTGLYQQAIDEIATIKEHCGTALLKVILETGELCDPFFIEQASKVVISGGADFIKTSTGKTAVGATPEAVRTMLKTITEIQFTTGKTIGLKVAGGISSVEEALLYMHMAEEMMGKQYVKKQTFRVGTSRLTNVLIQNLT